MKGKFPRKKLPNFSRNYYFLSRLLAEFSLKPTYFEIITALALQYFSQAGVEIAILEVGMGGRLDATNVFNESLVSIITNVNYEHTEYLGKRISDISRKKQES